MKKSYLVLWICILAMITWPAFSQNNVESSLEEAQSAYKSGNLEAARFALQQAMNEVDLAIGREVLALLPDILGPMSKAEEEDQVASASMGFAGLFVQRAYRSDGDVSAELQVLADSPLLAGINAILALPSFVSDANQKRIRVANYRAILKRNEDSTGSISWDIQVPFGSSLMTLQVNGIEDENAVVTMANTIPVDQVSRLIQ